MKIAIDIHGTIDACPKFFSQLTQLFKAFGGEIHITTGVPDTLELRRWLVNMGIKFDFLFSITDHHVAIGTQIKWDEKGHPHISDILWDPTKAAYCRNNSIDLAIDDSEVYGRYFTTPYLLFKKGGLQNEEK